MIPDSYKITSSATNHIKETLLCQLVQSAPLYNKYRWLALTTYGSIAAMFHVKHYVFRMKA